ncbi:class I SAM-dependent methyltransferase [Undibacterium sp. TC4M20W]|uniref:class I SAM-dependent methyltransferase n=2 Tax=unclassified Undibacterium TaxID=2630295 RepID=UPI003BF5B070
MNKMTVNPLLDKEKGLLEAYAANYITSDDSSQQRLMRELEIRVFKQFMKRGKALELGCEIGYMSELLSPLVDTLDIVDASQEFLDRTKSRNLPNANYFCSLFEHYEAPHQYDAVIASHVLEHLLDVQEVLKMVHKSLSKDGLLFVAVPNARALSRQLARHMGLLDSLYELTPNDLRGGHRRVYDRVTLNRELETAGFEIVAQGGIFFKYLADFQMDKMIDSGILGEPQLEGLFSLGNEYPDMCADVYAVVRKKTTADAE